MLTIVKSWMRTFFYFLFGLCLHEECYASSNARSIQKCGNVFITISSIKGSFIELNWNTNCGSGDVHPETIALYNTDIRNKTEEDILLYAEIRTENHPGGFFRTKVPFNSSEWPENWKFNTTDAVESGPQNFPYWIVSFSESDQIIDIRSLQIQPTWMNDNRDKLKSQNIGNLLIPGTHDSGCYGGLRLLEDYVLTQDMPIWHQLVFGIRYLDFRIAYHQDGMFWINHDIVKVKKLQVVFDQIKEFVRRSPGEIIIIDFHRFPFPTIWTDELHEKFINYTLGELGEYAYSRNHFRNSKGPTLDEIWNANKNIIITYGKKTFVRVYQELWDPIPQYWADTLSVKSLKKFLENSLNHRNNTIFNALMAELTPRFIDIITGVNTLRQLANDVNPKLTKWVRDEWKGRVNIITSDFFLGNDLVNVAIEINRNR